MSLVLLFVFFFVRLKSLFLHIFLQRSFGLSKKIYYICCCFDKLFCPQRITFQKFLKVHFLSFLNVRMGETVSLSFQGFFKNIYPPFIHFYPHLFYSKTIKVKHPCQIKSSDNQTNPVVLKNFKSKRTFNNI